MYLYNRGGHACRQSFVAFNALRQRNAFATITLDGAVLGLEFSMAGLTGSDFLGLAGLVYHDGCANCGLDPDTQDHIFFLGNQVFIHSVFQRPGDFIRIISEDPRGVAAIPEPGLLSLVVGAAFLAFAAPRLRRR